MSTFLIEGYLTQAKLEHVLHQIVGKNCWRGREVRLPIGRRRWDMSYQIDSQITVVEYDGDEHYRNALKIKVDKEKDEIAAQNNYRVVRIPYWVQLTSETLLHYFGISADIQQSFPHGFVTTKLFPASFCELGLLRFEYELACLPFGVREAVLMSLRDRANEHGIVYVLPSKWQNFLAG